MADIIVVANRVRLGQDGGKFKKDQTAATERKGAKVSKAFIEKQNKLWATTGRLWTIDEKATAARNKSLEETPEETPSEDTAAKLEELKALKIKLAKAEKEKSNVKTPEREDLEARAIALGLTYPANIKDETLEAKVVAAEKSVDDLN